MIFFFYVWQIYIFKLIGIASSIVNHFYFFIFISFNNLLRYMVVWFICNC